MSDAVGNLTCKASPWHVSGLCGVSVVPINSISNMHILSPLCGSRWFIGAIAGLIFRTYLPDSHSSPIPFTRSPHVILFDDCSWFMLMPVAWYVASAHSLFPELMRSMNAS